MRKLYDEKHAEMTERYGAQVGHYIADALYRCGVEYAEESLRWFAFPQVFSSTAGLAGGIGGQMITEGQVVAVLLEDGMYVYSAGRFVYRMDRAEGMDCVRMMSFPSLAELMRRLHDRNQPPVRAGEGE